MIQYYMHNGSTVPITDQLTLRRVNDTTYVVESEVVGASANLKFQRLSDGIQQVKGIQPLPYTFTHVAGEIWEVEAGDGFVPAWGIDIPSGSYLQEEVLGSFEFPDYIYIDYYLPSINTQAKLMQLAGRLHMSADQNRWLITQSAEGVGLYTAPSAESLVKLPAYLGWNTYEMFNRGYELEQRVTGYTDITPTDPPYNYFNDPDTNKRFRMGQIGGGSSAYSVPFVGTYQSYTHGVEVFNMNEGTGTKTYGSNGRVLDLIGGANWVKL